MARRRSAKISGATYVVSYDQTNRAYHIDKSDYDDFVEWVAVTWETDYEPRGFWDEEEEDMIFECAQDYLDRRCINVRGV